jgi:WD40 repeat protein
VRVWDAAGRGEPVVLRGHEGGVNALAVLADERLVSGGDDRTVRVWNTRTGKMLAMFAADGTILSVLGLPNGMIAAGDGLGAVHFLDLIE